MSRWMASDKTGNRPMTTRNLALAGLLLAALSVAPALAQTGAAAVQARQANFKQLGGAFKAINDELKMDRPSVAVLQANSTKINSLAGQLPRWFPKGSGPGAGVKTGAKGEIWADAGGFATAARNFQAQAAQLQKIAAGGDADAVRAQARATGGTCEGCHDKFRLEDKK